ncbi:protein PHOSPHATE STARVATION RESPONSE 2-like [Silene latifolia]|uniref:protein PHOSPHATE STARVATION RESPONSE 2-like n=1 Tax=Silene latifolia TaxID=37657 RepID=UPI003D775216
MDPSVGNEPAPVVVGDEDSIYQCRRRNCFRWTPELRNRFDEAVNALGGTELASVGKILELMNNVDNIITKQMVGCQLQKYRIRAEGQSRFRNRQENSTYTAGALLVNPLNRLHNNSNDATSYTSMGNYNINGNRGAANQVDLTFVFYLD